MKGPFLTLAVMKGPFLTLSVRMGPFITRSCPQGAAEWFSFAFAEPTTWICDETSIRSNCASTAASV